MADGRVYAKSEKLMSFSGTVMAIVGVGLPFVGAFLCVLLSILFNFERSTATHCRVDNYLPSMSSAIGGFTPQRYIWRLCIALHSGPRFVALVVNYNIFRNRAVNQKSSLYDLLVKLTSLLNFVENGCLLLLTCVSSSENYDIHETSFIVFLVCSEVYMLLSIALFQWSMPVKSTQVERRSLKIKRIFFAFNLLSCLCAAYFFYRHNTYCESGVYSLFALCEYLVVLSNMAYHGSALMEFGHGKLLFVLPSNQPEMKSS